MFRTSRDVPYQTPRCKKCQRAKMNCRCADREAERRRVKLKPKGCSPVRQGSDEYRCLTCGRVWDTHEAKPECERDIT